VGDLRYERPERGLLARRWTLICGALWLACRSRIEWGNSTNISNPRILLFLALIIECFAFSLWLDFGSPHVIRIKIES
jgi:hypothetical protein